jgi:hypothetical protein
MHVRLQEIIIVYNSFVFDLKKFIISSFDFSLKLFQIESVRFELDKNQTQTLKSSFEIGYELIEF